MGTSDRSVREQRVSFEMILKKLRMRDFAVSSTVTNEGAPHATGVTYGVSRHGGEFSLYVMTRRHLKKARNISGNRNVSLVVPLTRRLLWFLPPPCIQLRGRAEILDWTDSRGKDVFGGFWKGRRILEMYQDLHRRGETRICFLKISPDPVISSYMVGYSVWELRKRMESGMATVVIPAEYRTRGPLSGS